MKKFVKKGLALLLVLILTVSAAVPALAYDTGSEDITSFYASIDSYGIKPTLRWLNMVLDSRFTTIDEGLFSFILTDSNGKTVADETKGRLEYFTPADNDGFGFEVFFYFDRLPAMNPNETYSLNVPAGIFATDNSEQSAAFVVSFAASEFISIRPGFLGFLDRIYNTPVLRILFFPLIAVIEAIYYISVYFAML